MAVIRFGVRILLQRIARMALSSSEVRDEPRRDGVVTASQGRPYTAPGRLRPFLQTLLLQPVLRGVGVGLLCALAAWLLGQTGTVRGLGDCVLDGCFIFRGARPTQANIVLIGLDDDSLNDLKKSSNLISPELATVVTYLHQQEAAAIGIDLFVPQSMSDLPEIEDEHSKGEAAPLGEAILEAGNVVLPQRRIENHWELPLRQWQLKALDPEHRESTDLGFVNCTEDDDQFVRRQQLLIADRDQNTAVPHFALALLARARNTNFSWDDARQELRFGDESIPLDSEQKLRINFAGPPGTFPAMPFRDVLRAAGANRPLPKVQGAIVLIGVTAPSAQDYHATPYANQHVRFSSGPGPGLMSGTEVHAHILATLDDRAYIHALSRPASLALLLILGAVLGAGYLWLRPRWGVLLAVALPVAWIGLCLAAFVHGNWRIEAVTPLLTCFLTCGLTAALRQRLLWMPPSEANTLPPVAGFPTGPYSPRGRRLEPSAVGDSARSNQFLIADYEVIEELGRGGMGVVYKATQVGLKRTVALKMILAGPHASPDTLTRFRIEAEAVARMQHPNIVQVYEIGEHDGRPFFSLEFVDGGSLAKKLDGKPLPARAAVALLIVLGRAVQHAHERGVIHRYLKPANILLAFSGQRSAISKDREMAPAELTAESCWLTAIPKITDFGLAKKLDETSGLSYSGAVMGSPSYMAPEQAEGRVHDIGPATDVYALGAILYELLTGRPPFKGDTFVETLDQVRFQAPRPPLELQPTVPPVLEAICLKCLAKEPARRYPTAEALVQALMEVGPC
jgi:CHASE2 domain-containing sensor protein